MSVRDKCGFSKRFFPSQQKFKKWVIQIRHWSKTTKVEVVKSVKIPWIRPPPKPPQVTPADWYMTLCPITQHLPNHQEKHVEHTAAAQKNLKLTKVTFRKNLKYIRLHVALKHVLRIARIITMIDWSTDVWRVCTVHKSSLRVSHFSGRGGLPVSSVFSPNLCLGGAELVVLDIRCAQCSYRSQAWHWALCKWEKINGARGSWLLVSLMVCCHSCAWSACTHIIYRGFGDSG